MLLKCVYMHDIGNICYCLHTRTSIWNIIYVFRNAVLLCKERCITHDLSQ